MTCWLSLRGQSASSYVQQVHSYYMVGVAVRSVRAIACLASDPACIPLTCIVDRPARGRTWWHAAVLPGLPPPRS